MDLPLDVSENLEMLKTAFGDNASLAAAYINFRAGRSREMFPTADTIINQLNLIESELIEGKVAAANGDLMQVRDACCDIVLLAFGVESLVEGLDLNDDYFRMLAFNMTRIPKTLEEAEATVQKYLHLGILSEIHTVDMGHQGYVYPVRTIGLDQTSNTGEEFAPNKFLKSVNFKDVTYDLVSGQADQPFIQKTETAHAKAGVLFSKNFASALSKKVRDLGGTHGTVPVRDVVSLIESLVGTRL